eukprot:6039720-Karenia_brevis.AAC.1
MQSRDPGEAYGALFSMLQRGWGLAAWRATARLLLDRLEHVGRGADPARRRRMVASDCAAASRSIAQWQFR